MLPRTKRRHVTFAASIFLVASSSSSSSTSAFVVPSRQSTRSPHETPRPALPSPPRASMNHSSVPRSYFRTNNASDVVDGGRATTLRLHPSPIIGASVAVAGSSLVGYQASRWFPSGGILGTLVTAACFGNLFSKYVPTSHRLYDLCFTHFLPGSLTLLLLAYRPPPKSAGGPVGCDSTRTVEGQDPYHPAGVDENSIASCIGRVAVPFGIASVASLVGCWLSHRCAMRFGWFSGVRHYAQAATGCLAASYVGGSVNCMATARLVRAPTDLLGSLVTADLLTMAIYFSFLSSSLEWDWLASKFQQWPQNYSRTSGTTATAQGDRSAITIGVQSLTDGTKATSAAQTLKEHSPSLRSKCLASIPLLLGTFAIVQTANRVEAAVGRWIPGTACAVIAVVAPVLNSFVSDKLWWRPFAAAATPLSDLLFLSFFSSIGVAVDLSSALSMGPSCLLFSAIALSVHVLGTVAGCLLLTKLRRTEAAAAGNGMTRLVGGIELEDVWIASNAAIGGPATAAAFCGRMTKRSPGKLRGRTISATVWGVVGYAVGTVIGVGMFHLVGGR